MNIMTPLGDEAKFVVVPRVGDPGFSLVFVDGHGYSRVIARSVITDMDATEFEWLVRAAAVSLGIEFQRERTEDKSDPCPDANPHIG
jgi:hypothetical protein